MDMQYPSKPLSAFSFEQNGKNLKSCRTSKDSRMLDDVIDAEKARNKISDS